MAEGKKRGRWYWHCHACGKYVPREQDQCSCGAAKQPRRRSETASRPLRSAGGLAFGVGMVLLWLVLLWLVLREHTPPPAKSRRRGASEASAVMTQLALDSRARSPHTCA